MVCFFLQSLLLGGCYGALVKDITTPLTSSARPRGPFPPFWFMSGTLVVCDLGSAIFVKAQVNLNAGGNWVPFMEPPDYGHPGQYGASFYYASQLFCQTVCFPVSVGISHSLTGRGHSQGATSVAKYCGVPETATWCCTLLASSWIQQFGCIRCHVLAMSRHKSLPPKFSVTQLSTDQNVGS